MPDIWTVVGTCVLIVLARVGDVTLGTLRMVAVINGRRWTSLILGFFEVLVWVLVVSRVITTLHDQPVYAVAYALGFALGTYIGVTIESRIAFGRQVARVFTRRVEDVAAALRTEGYRVTEFVGRGRDGPVGMLFIETRRRDIRELLGLARRLDPECYYVVDDIRTASSMVGASQKGEILSILKGK
jgi:uncharacterized protein YebE (UPF0316 family)